MKLDSNGSQILAVFPQVFPQLLSITEELKALPGCRTDFKRKSV